MPKHLVITPDDIIREAKTYISDPDSLAIIKKAINYATLHHDKQLRKSGEPYVVHLFNVGYILATLKVGPKTIAAGILHDTVEDTGVISNLKMLRNIRQLIIVRSLLRWLKMFVLSSLN